MPKSEILLRARELGFDLVRVAPPELPPHYQEAFERWIAAGQHGTMDYLARRVREPRSLADLLPGVRSVLVLGINYWQDHAPVPATADDVGQVSRYAVTRDYTTRSREKNSQRKADLNRPAPCNPEVRYRRASG